jgi:hypothetical protein
VAVLLVSVALVQLTLAHSLGLTPWKGGGFGMFSTVDQPAFRFVRVEVTDRAGRTLSVAMDQYVDDAEVGALVERARAMPNQRALHRIAADVRDRSWTRRDGLALPLASDEPGTDIGGPLDLSSVTVSVWAFMFDAETEQLTPRLVHSGTWQMP